MLCKEPGLRGGGGPLMWSCSKGTLRASVDPMLVVLVLPSNPTITVPVCVCMCMYLGWT